MSDCLETSFKYKIVKGNRKKATISVTMLGDVIIKTPLRCKEQYILDFIKQNEQWVESKLSNVMQGLKDYNDVINLKQILLFGKLYNIEFADVTKNAILNEKKGVLCVPKYCQNKQISLQNIIKKFLKTECVEYINQRLPEVAKIMQLEYSSFKITNSKTKWGACNTKNELFFNFALPMLQKPAIDYVIVHELSHILQMNHSKKFWNTVTNFVPNVKQIKSYMKKMAFLTLLYR